MTEPIERTPWALSALFLILVLGSNGCTCMPSVPRRAPVE